MTDIFRRLRHNFWEIYDPLHDRGFNDREIAEELGIHPGTLMRYKRMQINRDKETQKKKIEEVMKAMKNGSNSFKDRLKREYDNAEKQRRK